MGEGEAEAVFLSPFHFVQRRAGKGISQMGLRSEKGEGKWKKDLWKNFTSSTPPPFSAVCGREGRGKKGKGKERSKFSGKGSGGWRRKEKEENSAVQEGLQRTDRTGEADSTQKEEHTRGNKRKELLGPPPGGRD